MVRIIEIDELAREIVVHYIGRTFTPMACDRVVSERSLGIAEGSMRKMIKIIVSLVHNAERKFDGVCHIARDTTSGLR